MSPARRLLLSCLAVVAAVVAVVAVVAAVLGPGDRADVPLVAVPQDQPGPVLLVPGYGGSTSALEVLAVRLRAEGRMASVVLLPGDGTGDLAASADVLDVAVEAALAGGAPSVDVVGYSAGGVVARIWADGPGRGQARRVVTLGSPHDGTDVAGLAARFAPGACPPACMQLVPDSDLLDELAPTPDGPAWLSLWTSVDEVVTPPDSARLDGAINLVLQDLCPGSRTTHGDLPRDPAVQGVVLAALGATPLAVPATCPA